MRFVQGMYRKTFTYSASSLKMVRALVSCCLNDTHTDQYFAYSALNNGDLKFCPRCFYCRDFLQFLTDINECICH